MILPAFIFILIVFISGILLSFKYRFLQITKLPRAFSYLKRGKVKNGMSAFAALSSIIGGNLGTGNISGVAMVFTEIGPGAIFWMWVMAIIGAIFKYCICFLSVKHRKYNTASNEYTGGAPYYIKNQLKMKFISYALAIMIIFAAFLIGNIVQINSIVLPATTFGMNPIFCAIGIMIIFFIVSQNNKIFAKSMAIIVPIMAMCYTLFSMFIILKHYDRVPNCFLIILKEAFAVESFFKGGFLFAIINVIAIGFSRGIFATDCALGLEGILHSNVPNENNDRDFAKKQATISMLSPFIVAIICTITALTIMVTDAHLQQSKISTNMCVLAFQMGLVGDENAMWPAMIVVITLLFFALTTIMTWYFCASKMSIFVKIPKKIIRILFGITILTGAIWNAKSLWQIADIMIYPIVIINIFAILMLKNRLPR